VGFRIGGSQEEEENIFACDKLKPVGIALATIGTNAKKPKHIGQ
jgi:hypothetical protein